MKFKIQFVFVNATNDDRFEIEKRTIQEKVVDVALIFDSPAARVSDVIIALRKNKPDVVHFGVHGYQSDEIVLLDDSDEPSPIARGTLVQLFEHHQEKNRIRLVVLNACYSAKQARVIKEFVDCVIAIRKTIPNASAMKYSLLLYDALASGTSVLDAHKEGLTVIAQDRLPKDRQPQLLHREGVNPARIYLTTRSTKRGNPPSKKVSTQLTKLQRNRKDLYKESQDRYRLRAESFSLAKIVRLNGASDMFYELKGLQYDGDGAVDGLYFLLETQAGVVSAPVRDKNAEDLHISWQPDSYPEPTTMEEVIDRVRRVSGIFWFEQSLRRKSSYTFGWTIRVLNGDALTAWDFDNMYPTPETRQHVNGNQLDSKIEYLRGSLGCRCRS